MEAPSKTPTPPEATPENSLQVALLPAMVQLINVSGVVTPSVPVARMAPLPPAELPENPELRISAVPRSMRTAPAE